MSGGTWIGGILRSPAKAKSLRRRLKKRSIRAGRPVLKGKAKKEAVRISIAEKSKRKYGG